MGEDEQYDLRELKMKRWRPQENNRKEWTSLVKEAEVPLPVTGREGPGCETSRLPHFLDNRLIDGGDKQINK
jgi:hypothetical protein